METITVPEENNGYNKDPIIKLKKIITQKKQQNGENKVHFFYSNLKWVAFTYGGH
jgi:hypothetical protein